MTFFAEIEKKSHPGVSFMVQWLRPCLPIQGMKVQSLVRELRSHMPQGNQARVPK